MKRAESSDRFNSMDVKEKKPNLGITSIDEPGSFIYVDKVEDKYAVVFKPDNEPNKLYVSYLYIDYTIDYIEEMNIPAQYASYIALKITKTLTDSYGSHVYIGSINFKEDPQVYYKFSISEREFKLQEKVSNYHIKDTVQGIQNTAYKTIGNITHFIGVRKSTDDEVYVKYNNTTDTIESEIAYFSELGDIYLNALCLTKENTVLLCGHISNHNKDNTPTVRTPYINVVLS
jgi:hypothetical protein